MCVYVQVSTDFMCVCVCTYVLVCICMCVAVTPAHIYACTASNLNPVEIL